MMPRKIYLVMDPENPSVYSLHVDIEGKDAEQVANKEAKRLDTQTMVAGRSGKAVVATYTLKDEDSTAPFLAAIALLGKLTMRQLEALQLVTQETLQLAVQKFNANERAKLR
jgi:hypothetical protein